MAPSRKTPATPRKNPPKRRRVQFVYSGPAAAKVCLSGDFNQWSDTKHPMKQGDDGVWKKIVMLTPGRYEYKFCVDGRWVEDPANGHRCLNTYGSFNCVLHVS